jgi:UDP-N-acetylmuramate dehydrogenase
MIRHNYSLKKYNTFGIDCSADTFITAATVDEVVKLISSSVSGSKPLFILGGGSNILFLSDYKGTILHPEIMGIKLEKETDKYAIVSAGAGIIWDKLVEWCVEMGFGGIENLSLIPGMVGATPVQNIGAYGVEVKETIEKVIAVSLTDATTRVFSNEECRFAYRDSIFKNELKGKYLITRVHFRLSKNPVLNTGYGSIKKEVEKLGKPSILTVRQAVIKIRKSKLPDPAIIGNAGSFFRNPVLNSIEAERLKKEFPEIPLFPDPCGGTKVAAGWMIEYCGWKGKRSGDAGVHERQALVLVNHGKASGSMIFGLSERIRQSVKEKFGIILEREVEII